MPTPPNKGYDHGGTVPHYFRLRWRFGGFEIIAAEVESTLLTEAGYQIAADEMAERFAGLTWQDILLTVEREAGIPLSASLLDKSEKILDEKLKNEVQAVEDIVEVVSALKLPKCICSNSTSHRLESMLKRVGLYELFAPNIFSAKEVGTKRPSLLQTCSFMQPSNSASIRKMSS